MLALSSCTHGGRVAAGAGWGGGSRGAGGRAVVPWGPLLCPQDSLGCRLVFLLMQYCVAANHYWLLVEGVYLYALLAFSVFSEQRVFRLYLGLGWGKARRRSAHAPLPPNLRHRRWETLTSLGTAAFRLPPPPREASVVLRTRCWASGSGPLGDSLLGAGPTAGGCGCRPLPAKPYPLNGSRALHPVRYPTNHWRPRRRPQIPLLLRPLGMETRTRS